MSPLGPCGSDGNCPWALLIDFLQLHITLPGKANGPILKMRGEILRLRQVTAVHGSSLQFPQHGSCFVCIPRAANGVTVPSSQRSCPVWERGVDRSPRKKIRGPLPDVCTPQPAPGSSSEAPTKGLHLDAWVSLCPSSWESLQEPNPGRPWRDSGRPKTRRGSSSIALGSGAGKRVGETESAQHRPANCRGLPQDWRSPRRFSPEGKCSCSSPGRLVCKKTCIWEIILQENIKWGEHPAPFS